MMVNKRQPCNIFTYYQKIVYMFVYREQSPHVLAADADADAENMENEIKKEGGSHYYN